MRLKYLWRNGTFALLVLVVPGQPAVAGTAPIAGHTLAETLSAPWNADQIPQAGPDNALGQVAIRFANLYSVYLHDTPHRELFNGQRRATSSGCIQVEKSLKLVELLFNDP